MSYHPIHPIQPILVRGLSDVPDSPVAQFGMGASMAIGLGLVAVAAWMFLRSDEAPPRRFDDSRYDRPEKTLRSTPSPYREWADKYGGEGPWQGDKWEPGGKISVSGGVGTYSPPTAREIKPAWDTERGRPASHYQSWAEKHGGGIRPDIYDEDEIERVRLVARSRWEEPDNPVDPRWRMTDTQYRRIKASMADVEGRGAGNYSRNRRRGRRSMRWS